MPDLVPLDMRTPKGFTWDVNFRGRRATVGGASVSLDKLIKPYFARSSTAQGYGVGGNRRAFAVNQPRFVTNPAADPARHIGLMMEAGSNNLIVGSNDFSTWERVGAELFAAGVKGINPGPTGTRVVETGTAVSKLTKRVAISTGVSAYIFGAHGRMVGTQYIRLRYSLLGGSSTLTGSAIFDLKTGKVFGYDGVLYFDFRIAANGYFQIGVGNYNTVGANQFVGSIERLAASDPAGTYDICESFLYPKAALTSHIETGAGAATRADETLSIPLANLGGINPNEGTLLVEFIPYGDPQLDQFLAFLRNDAGTTTIGFQRSRFGSSLVGSGTGSAYMTAYGAGNGVANRAALSWAHNNWALAMTGGTYKGANILTGTGGIPQGLTTLDVGHLKGGQIFDGALLRVAYADQRLANANLSGLV